MLVQIILRKFPKEMLVNVSGEAKNVESLIETIKAYARKHDMEVKMASVLYAVAEKQVCKECGCEFGTDEAKKCNACLSYICPRCGVCNCIWGFPVLSELPT